MILATEHLYCVKCLTRYGKVSKLFHGNYGITLFENGWLLLNCAIKFWRRKGLGSFKKEVVGLAACEFGWRSPWHGVTYPGQGSLNKGGRGRALS